MTVVGVGIKDTNAPRVEGQSHLEKTALLVTVILSAIAFIPECENISSISSRSISILSASVILAQSKERDKKFLLESIKVLSVIASLCGTLGLGGKEYATHIAVGSLSISILCRMGILAVEEEEEGRWQAVAGIVVSLLTLGAMLFEVNNLMITASIINLLVLGYIVYASFASPKERQDYFKDMCRTAQWIISSISLAKKLKFL